ncbi:hypothetical protein BDW62DRAFT_180082 [Aspergillus aurantiobrunneus]
MASSLRARRRAAPARVNTKAAGYYHPEWTVVQTRYSNTTDFDDTDFEFSDEEDESPRVSMGSFGYDSNSSLSTPELPTPDNAPRQPFTFNNLEKMTQGPTGPHLFRSSVGSVGSIGSAPPTAEVDLYFERSPLQTQFAQSESEPTDSEPTPNKYQYSPCTPKAFATLHPDVSQVEEQEIRGWTPSQVAHWMHIGGYDETVIDKFLINDINGTVLLSLQAADLKELGIKSFGKRHQVMASIDHLRNTMLKTNRSGSRSDSRSQSPTKRRSYAMSVSPTGEILSGFENAQGQAKNGHVSIVGIEQVLPKPHNCSKGENCPKYRRRKRQIEKLAAEYPNTVFVPAGDAMVAGNPGNPDTAQNLLRPTSDAQPSVAASSDVFGNMQTPRLCAEALNEVTRLDPQESIRHFLSYQGVEPSSGSDSDESNPHSEPIHSPPVTTPKTAPAVVSRGKTRSQNLRSLPKLTIPVDSDSDGLTTATTTAHPNNTMYGSPTATQEYGPFTNAQYMPSIDRYRQGTPFTEADVPVTAIPDGPIARETSQSVPPNMQYGNLMLQRQQQQLQEPYVRAASARPRASSKPLPRVHEDKPLTPIENPEDLQKTPRIPLHGYNSSLSSDPDVTKTGWMKKRKPARFLRHDWQDAHFTLRGTNLAMHRDELAALRHSRALDLINVDDYTVACSSLGTNSKLTTAFKKSVLRAGANPSSDDAAFAFSLVPASKENEKKVLFSSKGEVKSHHFAVKTRDERIDWMRELMLAKALKKGKEGGAEMQVNGNFI